MWFGKQFIKCKKSNILLSLGQEYNLTGTSEYATLREAFTWTCDMFVPPGELIRGVKFFRNNVLIVTIGIDGETCRPRYNDLNYSSQCKSNVTYTLTIPANRMTEFEQKSIWRCEYVILPNQYRSPDVILKIASKTLFKMWNWFYYCLFSVHIF